MRFRRSSRRTLPDSIAARVPGVAAAARLFARISAFRVGRVPLGLVALLPISLAIDLFDVGDELFGGPIGMALSFVAETAFVLGVTGKPFYALGFAGLDLIPGIDVIPVATITLLREIAIAWREGAPAVGPDGSYRPDGPVIDV